MENTPIDSESVLSTVSSQGSASVVGSVRSFFNTAERALLLTLIEERKAIIEDKRTTFGPKTRKTKAWLAITSLYNSDPGVNKKTTKQLKNWWMNSKKRAKKAVSCIK